MKKGLILILMFLSLLSCSEKVFMVDDSDSWDLTRIRIMTGGNNKKYVIKIIGNIHTTAVLQENYNSFGYATGIKITLQGDGNSSLALINNGSLFNVGNDQTVIIKDLALKGYENNDAAIVTIKTGGTFIMEGYASVSGNAGYRVPGIRLERSGTFIMRDNSSVSNNTGYGVIINGGVSHEDSIFIMYDNSSVSKNTGGGVYLNGLVNFTMQSNSTVSGNIGGGVSLRRSGTFIMQDNSTVSQNSAAVSTGNSFDKFGGVSISDGNFTMQDNASVSGNTSNISGGGVIINDGTFTMQDNASVSGNTSNRSGGGVIINGGTFTIQDNSSVSGNTARYGGGLFLTNATFIKKGGIIYGIDEIDENLRNNAENGYAIVDSTGDRWRNITANKEADTDQIDFWLND